MPLSTTRPNTSNAGHSVFTVSQLNQRAKQLLEISFASVKVEGELSSLSRPASGHWYFTLKDSQAQVRCAMFRSRTAQLKWLPKEGDQVEVTAKVSLYENRGDYQLIVDRMKPAGEGALLLAFEQLKTRLSGEGLFDAGYKKPLPAVRRVGLVTSATGAAVHDVLAVFKRRCPHIEVDIYPTQVQGKEATANIVTAIERANRDNQVDVLIVGRGGGSLEDLWCFNEEAVARAIFASHIPVVSAVGHEVDVTIADFVADVRAPTPSAAAELISPDNQKTLAMLHTLKDRLQHGMQRQYQTQQQRLLNLQQRLRSPAHLLESRQQGLDQTELRLRNAFEKRLTQQQKQLAEWHLRLHQQHPQQQLTLQQERIEHLSQRLRQQIQTSLAIKQQQFGHQLQLLNSLSPLQVLQRGYSVTTTTDDTLLHSVDSVSMNQRIHTRLSDGWLESDVVAVHHRQNQE